MKKLKIIHRQQEDFTGKGKPFMCWAYARYTLDKGSALAYDHLSNDS